MSTDEKTIEHFRALSHEIDNLFDSGKEKKGEKLLRQCIDEACKKDKAYHLFFQGELDGYINENSNEQLRLFEEAIKERPEDFFLLRNIGAAYFITEQLDKGMEFTNKAIELNPNDFNSWRQKGVSLSKKGDQDAAIICFDKAIKINPNDYNSWRQKGVSLSKKDDKNTAIICFDKAIELNPQDLTSLCSKSITLYNFDENIDKAIECVSEALKIKPDSKEAGDIYTFLVHRKTPKQNDPLQPKIEGPLASQTLGIITRVRSTMESKFQSFIDDMKAAEEKLNKFINDKPKANPDGVWFHVLRKWNSYTPILPSEGPDKSVGGGYFLQSYGTGIVIDPGFGFIDNFFKAGFRVADINTIVITHAHNDHNSDLESLLTLFYKHNSNPGNIKKVDLYLNIGAFQKFSGILNLRSTNYIGNVYILTPDHVYKLNEKTSLKALRAYHDEVITTNYSVGLWFTINAGSEERNIIISSDTSLYPPGEGKEKVIVEESKEIWNTYGIDNRKIHLLVPHLGSIKEQEFTKNYKDANEMFYRNHLGILGTAVLISRIKPELAVISEFGEELRNIQGDLINLLKKVIIETTDDSVKLLPGDIGLIYDVLTGEICCQFSGKMYHSNKIIYGCSEEEFSFYCKSAKKNPELFTKSIEKWKENRRNGNLFCHIPSAS